MAAGLDDLVQETHSERFLGGDHATGQDHVEGPAEADDSRQPLRAAVDQGHAEAPLREAEGRTARGHAQVAPQGELEPAGQAPARDRRDRRLRRDPPGEAERPLRQHQPRDERLDGLEVGAGAEGLLAAAGEHEDARLVVGLEALDGTGEQLGGGPVDGVTALGTVDGEHRGGAAVLVADGRALGAQRATSPRAGGRRPPCGAACACPVPRGEGSAAERRAGRRRSPRKRRR